MDIFYLWSFVLLFLALLFLAYRKIKSSAQPRYVREGLEGVWVEHVPAPIGHSISVGKIYYDRKVSLLKFDGTNYNDDLTPNCYWSTYASFIDTSSGFFQYTFHAEMHEAADKIYNGFGVVRFRTNDKILEVTRGFYISVDVDKDQFTHSMHKPAMLQGQGSYKNVYSPEELATILESLDIPHVYKSENK